METMVWWSAGGESFNKEVKWRPLYGGAQVGKVNKEVEWRPPLISPNLCGHMISIVFTCGRGSLCVHVIQNLCAQMMSRVCVCVHM